MWFNISKFILIFLSFYLPLNLNSFRLFIFHLQIYTYSIIFCYKNVFISNSIWQNPQQPTGDFWRLASFLRAVSGFWYLSIHFLFLRSLQIFCSNNFYTIHFINNNKFISTTIITKWLPFTQLSNKLKPSLKKLLLLQKVIYKLFIKNLLIY